VKNLFWPISRSVGRAAILIPALLPMLACANAEDPAAPVAQAEVHAAAVTTAPLPFKGKMEGRHMSRTPIQPPLVFDVFELTGQATQLGQFKLVIESAVNFTVFPVTGSGTFTFTAANGDKLVAAQTGSSRLLAPGVVLITEVATVDPERSTGRFAGATGSLTAERRADAATGVTGITSGSFEGTITLR
jgi:hypothetical protein